jgi:hypothetical protein
MKCPHCEKEIPGSPCPECGGLNPEEANYCMDCGLSLKEKAEANSQEEDVLDLENRVLCSDGTCTGILVDGKCTECGKGPVYDKDTEN